MLAPTLSATAFAQSSQTEISTGSGSSWTTPLIIALLLTMVVAAFWKRRLAHELHERRRLEKRLLDLTSSLPACVVEYKVNPDGTMKCLFANPSARELFRLPAGEHSLSLNDPAFLKHVHPDDQERLRSITRRSVETLDPIDVSFQFCRADGVYRMLKATMAVRVMNDGGLVWTGSIHDTTDEHALKTELRNLGASKDLFISAASKELRQPIHAIGLALDQLIHESDDSGESGANRTDHERALARPEVQSHLRQAHAASQRLRGLIDELLELAKVQRDDFPLRPSEFSVKGLLNTLAQDLQIPFARKSLKLVTQIDPRTPDILLGDHQRIQQVLMNLVNNALQHTDKGGVTITIAPCEPADNHNGSWAPLGGYSALIRFAVTDTGAGMTEEQLSRVFEPFVSNQAVATDALARRNQNAHPDDPAGTGVGLAIGRRIVTRLGGTIGIESISGSGTTAHFELPLEAKSTPAVASPAGDNYTDNRLDFEATTRRPKVPLRQTRRVLLVDDDRLGRTLLATLLGSDGFQVTEAGSGADALVKASQQTFDAVITDLRMPGMDGAALAEKIRQMHTKDPRLTAVPRLVALSASLGGLDASNSAHDVFDVLLQKPVALAELVDVLESAETQPATIGPASTNKA